MRRMWGLLAVFLLAASAPAEEGVTIDATNFPDTAFRDYVKDEWDKDNNGTLSGEEIATVDFDADVSGKDIESLKGIEHFKELKKLYCFNNRLTELDVSKNTALVYLYCSTNRLTALDVSKNTKLKGLHCEKKPPHVPRSGRAWRSGFD